MTCGFLFGIVAILAAISLFNVALDSEGYGQLATEQMQKLVENLSGHQLDEYHAYVSALIALALVMVIFIVLAWRSYMNEVRM